MDDAVLLWDKLFSSVVNIHAPLKFKRAKGTNNPWVSTKLTMIRRDRDYQYKKARIQQCIPLEYVQEVKKLLKLGRKKS